MPDPRTIGVLDVGKTNVKMVLHDLGSGTDLLGRSTPNRVLQDGPYPHFDVEAIKRFCLDSLAEARAAGLTPDALVVTTHGASGALITENDLALPVLDYEHEGPDEFEADYDSIRPAFDETYSPRLPAGLNLGAQLVWQNRRFPELFGRARAIVTYPQFWAWWLTGVAATEVTSLGAHTDLWNPGRGAFTDLPARAGFPGLLAPLRRAWEPLGAMRQELAGRLGLERPLPVLAGIHDSNAALLPYRLAAGDRLAAGEHLDIGERNERRAGGAPMTVISTGTWLIAFGLGLPLAGIDPERDTLANVDLFGVPVPSARFMAGREFELIAAPGAQPEPDPASIGRIIERRIMVLPTLVPGSGPFRNRRGEFSPTGIVQSLEPDERVALASLYAGLVTHASLAALGARGPSVVEGPFNRNALYLAVLARLTGRPVLVPTGPGGSAAGAALLATIGSGPHRAPGLQEARSIALGEAFDRYAALWAERAAEGSTPGILS